MAAMAAMTAMTTEIMGTCCSCGCEATILNKDGNGNVWRVIDCETIKQLSDPDEATLLESANVALGLCKEDCFPLCSNNVSWVRDWNDDKKEGSLIHVSENWTLVFKPV